MKTEDGNTNDSLLRLVGLEIGYRKGSRFHSLSGKMDCNVSGGELVSLMGRNGSGKSTLLRTIAGLQDPVDGKIIVEGRQLDEYKRQDLAKLLGFVSTEVIRVQGLRVRDLVAMGRYPYTGWFGSLSAVDNEMIAKAIELTSLQPLVERDLDELSDGERQRAMIARTLAQDTRILVLDEPTAFLDLTHKYEVTLLLGELARKHGKTIVFSTHDLQLSLQEADKIWLMHEGDIIEGAPEDLVLGGQIEKGLIPDGSAENISLDPLSGDLSVQREYRATVSISGGSEVDRLWTRRSLERQGLKVEENKTLPVHVLVKRGEGSLKLQLQKSGEMLEFKSYYELSLYLRTIL
ncbi:ABC transporter ATP-binding protein [Bacteroidota bacterium]